MKKISKNAKIVALIIAIIILVGMMIIFTIGLNFDLRYQEAKKVQLYLGKSFEIRDIQEITKEILPNEKVIIQKVEVFEDTVSILAKEITEEQKNNIIQKINEKYELELANDSTQVTDIPHTRGRDIIRPYLFPFAMATFIIVVYMMIRYYSLGFVKTLGKIMAVLIIAQIILLSLMAIIRIPIGRLTIPLVLATYVLSLLGITTCFEKRWNEKKEEKG